MTIHYSPEANASLERYDTVDRALSRRIDQALDDFESDPKLGCFRTRSYLGVDQGAFGFIVRGESDDVLVLWQQTNAGDVLVQYIGPPI